MQFLGVYFWPYCMGKQSKSRDVSLCWLDYLAISQIMPNLFTGGRGGFTALPEVQIRNLRHHPGIAPLSFLMSNQPLAHVDSPAFTNPSFHSHGPCFLLGCHKHSCACNLRGFSRWPSSRLLSQPPAAVLCVLWCSIRLFSIFCFKSYLGFLAFLKPKLFLWFAGLLNLLSVI